MPSTSSFLGDSGIFQARVWGEGGWGAAAWAPWGAQPPACRLTGPDTCLQLQLPLLRATVRAALWPVHTRPGLWVLTSAVGDGAVDTPVGMPL